MPSLREQILQKAPEDEPEVKTTETKPEVKLTSREGNLANLRKANEEREERLKSLEGENLTLKEKAARLEDPKFKALLETLETDYEDDPEKFVTEFKSLKETSTTWEGKLREKEELLERTAFEKSEAFQKNVAGPIRAGEELLKGVLKKDDALYKDLVKKFVYGADGKVSQGSLTADEIIALDEALENSDAKPERVQVAIESLREKFHSANEFHANFKTKIAQSEEERQKQLAAKNAEEAGLARIARAHAIKKAASLFTTDENLKALFDEAFLGSIPKMVMTTVENQITSRSLPPMEDLASNQMKAMLYDRLVADGGLDVLKGALEAQRSHSGASDGTRGKGRPEEKKPSGSVRDMLASAAGVERRFQVQ